MGSNNNQLDQTTDDTQTLPVVHWFIPLLIPLELPEIAIRSVHCIRNDDQHPGQESLFISIYPLKIETPAPRESESSFLALRASIPEEHRPQSSGQDEMNLEQASTVLEAIAIFQDGIEPDEEELSEIFDLVLAQIREIQRAHYIATKHAAPLISREQLPSIVAMLRREASPDEPGFPGNPGMYMVHLNSAHRITRTEPLDERQLSAFHAIIEGGAGVFAGYADFIREASVSLEYYGDYRNAVLNAATASETFLDILLIHLDWEDRNRPEDTAAKFHENYTISQRVKRLYGSRLKGGRWEIVGNTPIALWHQHCMRLRNRIVHAGYMPSIEEAREAIKATLDLQTHIADLLTSPVSLRKYLHTAFSFVGYPGLERRKLLSKRVIQELKAVTDDHLWKRQVQRYSEAVMMERARKDDALPPPDPMNSKLHIIYRVDETEEWVLLHEDSGLAATVALDFKLLSPETEETIKLQRLDFLKQAKAHDESISVRIIGYVGTPKLTGDWVPSYHLIPLLNSVRP